MLSASQLLFITFIISIILMQPFQATIITRGQQIQVHGNINHSQYQHAAFLKDYNQYPAGFLKAIYEKLHYAGSQLFTALIFFVVLAASELYNLFNYSPNIAFEISIVCCLLYTLLFTSIFNFSRQIIVQILFLCLSFCLLTVSLITSLFNKYTAYAVFFSIMSCLFCKLGKNLLERYYSQMPTPKFAFQSNLLLFQFLIWKGFQIVLDFLNLNAFNFHSLLITLIALAVVNSVKIYNLFDFQVYQVLNIFKENYEKSQNQDSKVPSPMTQSISIYIKNEKEKKEEHQTQKALQKQQLSQVGQEVYATSILKMDNNSIVNEKKYESDHIIQKNGKRYQSNVRILAFIIFTLANVAYLLYIFIKKQYSDSSYKSNLLWHSVSFIRTTVMLISCEYQKIIRGQAKDLLNYFYIYICDFSWLIFSAAMMLLPSIVSVDKQLAFMLSMIPFGTIKLFNYFDKNVHQNLNNSHYLSFVLLWLIPLSFREIGYAQNIQIVAQILDLICIIYAFFMLLIWSNKDIIVNFGKQVKKVLISKKDRLKVFQKLKTSNFQYSQIIQSYYYMHIIYLNFAYYSLSDISSLVQIIYLIVYCSPSLLYLLALINCQTYSINVPQSYRPIFVNVIIFSLCLVYAVVSQQGILPQNHQTWSLIVLLNFSIFLLALQGQKLAIVYFPAYKNFLRTLIISILFILIYFPFIVGFTSGYFITKFSRDYLFYYSLVGFFYIWLVITIVGMAIHWILNLTQKSKKELFVAKYMEGEMKKINIKEDIQKILMIYNMFELFNCETEDLLNYLKSQQHMSIVVRKQQEFEYDYELIEPQDKQKRRLSILTKPISVFDISKLVHAIINKQQSVAEDLRQNPVLIFFKQKERNKIQFAGKSDTNDSITELKRMITRRHQIPTNKKEIQNTQEWKSMVTTSNEKISEYMAKLFHFLTQPSKHILRQTFAAFLTLLTRETQTLQASNKVYNKFSPNGLIDQYKFKSFILDYVNFKYEITSDTLASRLKTFCCKEIVPLLLPSFDQFKYYISRKKLPSSGQSIEIWLKDKILDQNNSQFNLIKKRQAKKKAKLLKKNHTRKKTSSKDQQVQPEGENNDQPEKTYKPSNNTLQKAEKKQQKDKKFLKPQNIYAVLVNSLIQCNMYYQKQAQNFKIKTIKFRISNLLAIITKIIDIVFVFGYSTVYLFIAYYQQNFGNTYPFYSSISYYILLIGSVSLVLIYIILIVYHKSDFQEGTLGLDENQRSLGFKNVNFYTTTVLFLLGSSLANYILAIGLNSFICNQTTGKLYNFADQSCYNQFHYGYMLSSLLILVIYWPLSAITFPFSTAMNRDLQIKYKAQYEILYLQFKFLINGFNTLLNPYPFQTQQLINSISKVVICSTLALLYNQMQPCSYELLNRIEGKIYIILALLNFSGALCYFVGLNYSIIITGSILGLYLVYFIYVTIKSYDQLTNDNQENQILQDNIKNQKIKIEIIKQANQAQLQNEAITLESLIGKDKDKSRRASEPRENSPTSNSFADKNSVKDKKSSAKRNGFF